MRTLLVAALLFTVVGCDSTTPPEEEIPEAEFVGVTVAYRLTLSGESSDVQVTYTDADGETASDATDFSRQLTYSQEVLLEPGDSGTFTLTGSGIMSAGTLNARIIARRVDTNAEIGSTSETVTVETAGGEAFVTTSLTVGQVRAPVED